MYIHLGSQHAIMLSNKKEMKKVPFWYIMYQKSSEYINFSNKIVHSIKCVTVFCKKYMW